MLTIPRSTPRNPSGLVFGAGSGSSQVAIRNHFPAAAIGVADLRDRPDHRPRRQPEQLQLPIHQPLHPEAAKHLALERTPRGQVRRFVATRERLRERLPLLPPREQLHLHDHPHIQEHTFANGRNHPHRPHPAQTAAFPPAHNSRASGG